MTTTRIAIDGLWRCLCPSVDIPSLSRLEAPVQNILKRPCLNNRTTNAQGSLKPATARFTHSAAKTWRRVREQKRQLSHDTKATFTAGKLTSRDPPSYSTLDEVPIKELHESLRHLRTDDGGYLKIADLVEYLVTKRGEKPSILYYDALIRANSDASKGSADVVATLFHETKDQGLVPDSGFYNSVLQALAVHPDYLLRSEVLRDMKDRWFILTSDGWHDLIVGLLRDRQYEVALEKLEQMQLENIRVQPWLYDVIIYVFCDAEELDDALQILQHRVDSGDTDISANVWYYVLDACSSNYHYEGTRFVWRKRVETSYINPSDGMCTNVLNTAARHQDANLATDVVRVLNSRASKLDINHFEALVSAYAGSRDIKDVLHMLVIMKEKARLEPSESTTRPIYERLCSSETLPRKAFKVLQELQQEGKVIPTAAMNVVLEASVFHRHLQEAVTQYKALHTICSSGPNTATFNTLFKGCSTISGNKDLAMFLASEMTAIGIPPDLLTYDRLVLTCLNEEDYEDAFRYMAEMKNMFEGSHLRTGTWHALFRKCVIAGDRRAWGLLEEYEGRGNRVERLRRWAKETLSPQHDSSKAGQAKENGQSQLVAQ